MIKKLLSLVVLLTASALHSQNNYLDFDGTDDYVNFPSSNNIAANATSLTLSCKVFPRRVSSGFPNFNGIMGYRNETTFDFYLIQLSSTDVEARFRNSTGAAFTITYTGLTLNQWTQFFLVYNGSTLKLYNGTTEVGSVPANGSVPATSTGNLKIGLIQFQSFSWYHNGKIDEASLWNKALSTTEIATIVANDEILDPINEPNLLVYYKFNQGTPYANNVGINALNDALEVYNGDLTNFALTGNSSNWGSDTLGLNDFNNHNVTIYPNPATDYISISEIAENATIKITDMTGRTIKTGNYSSESKIEVSELPTGIYFLSIDDSKKMKFIKK